MPARKKQVKESSPKIKQVKGNKLKKVGSSSRNPKSVRFEDAQDKEDESTYNQTSESES